MILNMQTSDSFQYRLVLAVCLSLALLTLVLPAQTSAAPVVQVTVPPPNRPTITPSTQAGHGKDIFWLHCMPCHGDQGQGLTDEFRLRQYPPEDTNCWKSGCHGERPYADGFTLPKAVPALIGPDALQHFNTAQEMYAFVRKAMPLNAPGSLSDEQYLQVSAFLLESNQRLPVDSQLNPSALSTLVLKAASPTPTPTLTEQTSLPAAYVKTVIGIGIFLIAAIVLSVVTRQRRTRR
jgi:mono/diheme cytochrome c family protein